MPSATDLIEKLRQEQKNELITRINRIARTNGVAHLIPSRVLPFFYIEKLEDADLPILDHVYDWTLRLAIAESASGRMGLPSAKLVADLKKPMPTKQAA